MIILSKDSVRTRLEALLIAFLGPKVLYWRSHRVYLFPYPIYLIGLNLMPSTIHHRVLSLLASPVSIQLFFPLPFINYLSASAMGPQDYYLRPKIGQQIPWLNFRHYFYFPYFWQSSCFDLAFPENWHLIKIFIKWLVDQKGIFVRKVAMF